MHAPPVPQAIPLGLLTTEPDPVPASVTESGYDAGLKVACTLFAEFIVNEQVGPLPVQTMPHPANTLPAPGWVVRITLAPFATLAVQPDGVQLLQVTPETVPAPVPA